MGETQQAVADGLLFSIIMPAYNEQDVIADTVDALCTHLNGASHRYEVIIVDAMAKHRKVEINIFV